VFSLLTGVLAMDALHRQVLPFLLRRMKEDVLQDLPPKIIQDYYCTLSPLQVRSVLIVVVDRILLAGQAFIRCPSRIQFSSLSINMSYISL
jgi:SNF2 family DNA or RNA helicase